MALVFCDGFDKYGGTNGVSVNVISLLTAGEWTSAGANAAIVAPLSATGFSFQCGTSSTATKTLGGNYSRLIAGVRFNAAMLFNGGLVFYDSGTAQCSVTINSTGTISVRTGGITGTVLATSSASVTANSTHHLEIDITFATSGSYQVWLDGASIIGPSTGNTKGGTANAYATQFGFSNTGVNTTTIYDDLYVLDSTGSAPLNGPLLTSPRIETQFPNGDGAVQFAAGAAVLGSSLSRSTAVATAANQFRVHQHMPKTNCTINSVSFLPTVTNASIQLRPVVYSDSAGSPGTLLSAGSTVTGMTAGTAVTMPLTTPQALTGGTPYWVGFMCDIFVNVSLSGLDGTTTDRTATSTFASGAPGTAPAVSAATSVVMYGNISGASNYVSVSNNPSQGLVSYLYDATVGHEDLFNYPALSVTPSAIYAVAVKGSLSKSDAGAKTASLRMLSSATDSAGSAASISPGTSFAWASSFFPNDPNGPVAWTKAGLDTAQSGLKVET